MKCLCSASAKVPECEGVACEFVEGCKPGDRGTLLPVFLRFVICRFLIALPSEGGGGPMLVGYARVSKVDQETRLQLDAFAMAGVTVVYQEKASAVSSRPQLRRAISALRPGDVLVVWKLDRLARSLSDLLGLLEMLRQRGASFRSLTEPVDTSTPMGTFVIQILGAVAQLERSLIIQRTTAGLHAARARGVKLGRSRSLTEKTEARLVRDYQRGGVTLGQLAVRYGAHPSTVKRAVYRVTKPGHSSLQ